MSKELEELFGKHLGDNKASLKLQARERLLVRVTEGILAAMDHASMKRAHLARELNRTRGYVTQLLEGRRNMTLGTLSDIAFAVNCRVQFELVHPDSGAIGGVMTLSQPDRSTTQIIQFPTNRGMKPIDILKVDVTARSGTTG